MSSPTSKPMQEHGEWGKDTPQVRGGEGEGKICQAPLSYQRVPATAWSRPPRSACPPAVSPLRALPAGDSRIHWGLIHPYHEQTEFSEDVSRLLDQTVHPNSVANSVWQRAEARNRSREQEPDAPSRSYPRPHHQVDTSDLSRS